MQLRRDAEALLVQRKEEQDKKNGSDTKGDANKFDHPVGQNSFNQEL